MDWSFVLRVALALVVIQLLLVPIGAALLLVIYLGLTSFDKKFEARERDFEGQQKHPLSAPRIPR